MTKLVNRAKMTTASTGTGSPITLGSAVDGYQTFAAAGVADADVVRYVIEDGDAWEIGLGTYTASGTTLTRGSIESSNADNAINLTGNAVVYVSAAAADLQELVDFADNFVLPTADGSTGQVLTTNGAGTLSFTTISGYTDADVDTHLNTGTATTGEVLSWTGSDYDWVTVSGGATDINGLSDGYSAGSSLGLGRAALANDDGATRRNTAVGIYTLNTVSAGQNNTATGFSAGETATGSNNSFVGYQSGRFARTTTSAVGIGYQALYGTPVGSSGTSNIGIGYQTGYDLSTGAYNFLANYQAGTNLTTGSDNVMLGREAGLNATVVSDVIAIGAQAARTTNDDAMIAIGDRALYSGGGYGSIAVGAQALRNSSAGIRNVAIGGSAGFATTGDYNTFIGNAAGYSVGVTGDNNTVIGNGANASSTTVSNEITLGNSSIATLRCQVTTITSLSDARDKTDIQPLEAGLDFVNALEPVSFTWNMRDGGKVGEVDTGFIAQDLKRVQEETGITIPHLVFDANPEKLEAGYGKLIPVLVQAIKDLSAKVDELEARLEGK